MYKWVFAAVLYVAVVIGGYTVYAQYNNDGEQQAASEGHASGGAHQVSGGGHSEHGESEQDDRPEAQVYVQADQNQIKIFLRDQEGNSVDELEVNHEKMMHFIVVDDSLQKYYHLHPEKAGKGEFTLKQSLPAGFYKAFIDVKPKDLAYHVTPVSFVIGKPDAVAGHQKLRPDSSLTKTVDGETVQLKMSSFQTEQEVNLTFELDQSKLTPYLGAMGHVVILDEKAQQYLHVHPADEEAPVFETHFTHPGIYKIWAEFKQGGVVRAFPYVIEIKGEK